MRPMTARHRADWEAASAEGPARGRGGGGGQMVPPVPFPPKPLTAAGPSLPPKPSGPSPAARTSGSAATTSVLRCSGPAIRALSRQPCRPRQAHRASLSLQLMDSVGAPCSHKCGDVYESAQQYIVYLSSCTSKGGGPHPEHVHTFHPHPENVHTFPGFLLAAPTSWAPASTSQASGTAILTTS